jgi:diguanylate cyclase (GGDEF)-like protein
MGRNNEAPGKRALNWMIALSPLLIPAIALVMRPEPTPDAWALFWLFALAPALALAATEGWTGVLGATFAGTLVAILGEWVVRSARGAGAEPAVLGSVIVAAWLIAIGIGWLAARLRRWGSEAARMAYIDDLTGLPNRRHAREFLEREFAAARRGRSLSVAIFDLDEFKGYNDQHGHLAGDEALKTFANLLHGQTRQSNLVARLGGEEFICIMSGCEVHGAAIFAQRIRAAMNSRADLRSRLSVSAGVASFEGTMTSTADLISAADQALYEAKREGRDRVYLFTKEGVRPAALPPGALSLDGISLEPVGAARLDHGSFISDDFGAKEMRSATA